MSVNKHLSITVRGPDGSGRSVITAVITKALQEAGFTDVHLFEGESYRADYADVPRDTIAITLTETPVLE